MIEKRPGYGAYIMQEYIPKSSLSVQGLTETRINSTGFVITTDADQQSAYSGKRSQGSSARESSGKSARDEHHSAQRNRNVESHLFTEESRYDVIASHPLIIVPVKKGKRQSYL